MINKPTKESFDVEKTNHRTPALIVLFLGLPILLFAGMTRMQTLEQSFIYNEEARIASAKENVFTKGCTQPRQQYLQLVSRIEDKTEASSVRIKETYEYGFKEHKLYSAGEQLVKGEKYVDASCQQALLEVSKLTRGSSTNFIMSNFFGSK